MRILRAATVFAAILPVWAAIPETIHVEQGQIKGVAGNTAGILVFKGIPFAAPPVGDLRWKGPKAAASWNGVRAADKFGPQCIQRGRGGAANSEDCLYLNVYTPPRRRKRPVMVWIHGGALTSGAGSDLRRRGAGEKGRGRGHHQLSARRLRLLRASRAHQGIRPQLVRQLRVARSDRGARMGAEEHRGVRRRSQARHHLRRIGRIVERQLSDGARRSRTDCSSAPSAKAERSSRPRESSPTWKQAA